MINYKAITRALLGMALASTATVATSTRFTGPPSVAHADTGCATMLQGLQAWAARGNQNGAHYWVGFTLASNRANGLVSYAQGELMFVSSHNRFEGSNVLTGSGDEYFNTRTTSLPGPTVPSFGTTQPFNALVTDRLGVSINTVTGATLLTLLSWGGGTVHIPSVQCANGVLYGMSVDGDGNNVNTMETFSFSENVNGIPK